MGRHDPKGDLQPTASAVVDLSLQLKITLDNLLHGGQLQGWGSPCFTRLRFSLLKSILHAARGARGKRLSHWDKENLTNIDSNLIPYVKPMRDTYRFKDNNFN